MRHGEWVTRFERAFADRVNARHAIAMTNGTVTMEVALRALNVQRGDVIDTTPLTMAATSMAIYNVGAVPRYNDVYGNTWLMQRPPSKQSISVSLYGLHYPYPSMIDDAAQTLRPHGDSLFTSYSLQRSKIVQTGEGGVLVTNDEELAAKARSIASLGYDLSAGQSRIDVATLKASNAIRHVRHGMNARMNDLTAQEGIRRLGEANQLLATRAQCAALYRNAIRGIDWIDEQDVPDGATHDYWTFAVAVLDPAVVPMIQDAVVAKGGERPYGAWRLTFDEPAFKHQGIWCGGCPVARQLQPRILQFQTNDLGAAAMNAHALRQVVRSGALY